MIGDWRCWDLLSISQRMYLLSLLKKKLLIYLSTVRLCFRSFSFCFYFLHYYGTYVYIYPRLSIFYKLYQFDKLKSWRLFLFLSFKYPFSLSLFIYFFLSFFLPYSCYFLFPVITFWIHVYFSCLPACLVFCRSLVDCLVDNWLIAVELMHASLANRPVVLLSLL